MLPHELIVEKKLMYFKGIKSLARNIVARLFIAACFLLTMSIAVGTNLASAATFETSQEEAAAQSPEITAAIKTVIKEWASSASAAGQIYEQHARDVLKFYKGRNYAPLWRDDEGWSENSRSLLRAIETVGNDGLNPDHYLPSQLRKDLKQTKELVDVMAAVLDIMQTAALMHYSVDVKEGRYAENRALDPISLLAEGMASEDFDFWLDNLPPQKPFYTLLKRYIPVYEAMSNLGGWPRATVQKSIRPQTRSTQLPAIREQLFRLGDLSGISRSNLRIPHGSSKNESSTISDPAYYDQELISAVKSFQKRHGLDVDGIIGRQTAEQLNLSPTFRLQQIRLNLERVRWQKNEDAERYVHVNIASFWLKAYENGETVLEMPVAVGRDERPTPVLNDKIINLKFSPDWTIPPTIIAKDYLPKLQENPFYFEEIGWQVKQYGEPTAGYLIDWYSVNPKSISVVQPAGPRAPLGGVRFSLTNDQFIYLHDTPGKGVFKKSFRALSSGCVRVGDAPALAKYLLSNEGWAPERISRAMTSGDTKYKPLKKPVAVSLSYLTAWTDESGMIQFRQDIYDLDQALIEKMS
jgi:murein L,D-transpeptidase YcbB/YkuD